MTLDDAVKHQQIDDKRAIRNDTLEFLDTKRYSKSKKEFIRYGDMHLDHFFRVVNSMLDNEDVLAILIQKIVTRTSSLSSILLTTLKK